MAAIPTVMGNNRVGQETGKMVVRGMRNLFGEKFGIEDALKKKRSYPEFAIHKSIAQTAKQIFIKGRSLWHTTENSNGMGGVEGRKRQAKLKVLGVLSGFPDGMILAEGRKIIFCEIKAPKGTLSEAQVEIHNNLRAMGFTVEVLKSHDDFMAVIKREKIPTRIKEGYNG